MFRLPAKLMLLPGLFLSYWGLKGIYYAIQILCFSPRGYWHDAPPLVIVLYAIFLGAWAALLPWGLSLIRRGLKGDPKPLAESEWQPSADHSDTDSWT